VGREMAARIEKILCTVLHEAHGRQVEQTMESLDEGLEGSYGRARFFPPQPLPLGLAGRT
jgi:hypothetical protein